MTNRYFRPTVYQGDFYQPPLALLQQTLQQAQVSYDTNLDRSEKIKNYFINALPQDRPDANALQKGWNDKIDSIVASYSGDYSQASRDLNKLTSEIQREIGPGGKANQMETNYKTWTTAWKDAQEGIAKGTYTQQQGALMKQNFENSYKGVGERDPVTGTFAQANPVTLAPFVNAQKIIGEATKDIKPKKYKTQKEEFRPDGTKYTHEVEVEMYDPNEIEARTVTALASNDQWSAYVRQMAQLQGLDPNASVLQEANDLIENTKTFYRGINKDQPFEASRSDGNKIDRDPLYLQNLRQAHDMRMLKARGQQERDNMTYKHALDNDLVESPYGAKDDIRLFGTQTASQFKPIDPAKGVLTFEGSASGFNNPMAGQFETRSAPRYEKVPADVILKNPSKYASSINVPLLEAAYKRAQSEGRKDPSGVAFDYYNARIQQDHVGTNLYYHSYHHSDAGKEQFKKVMPQLEAGIGIVYKYDNRTHTFNVVPTNEAYEDIKKQAGDTTLGETSIVNGVPAGTVVPGSNGVYVVAEGNEDVRRMNHDLVPNAFGFANSPTRTTGGGRFTIPGTNQQAYGKVVYNNDLFPEPRYFDPTTNEMITIEGQPLTPEQLAEQIYPRSERLRRGPRGESKAKGTPFTY